MSHILVLGAGMVGSAIADDLAKTYLVTSADRDPAALERVQRRNKRITLRELDVCDHQALLAAARGYDLIVSAVPGFLGYETLSTLIEAGKPVADISFFAENALDLHDKAVDHGATVIVDTGVAPGMDNYILGHCDRQMTVQGFECLVGGLPKIKTWPFNYKAPFSPIDVIEEYTRPARYVENGKLVTKPALSDVELVEFEGVGTLEAFNTDGLRSIIHTMPHIPDMKEKTLRYPGHVEVIQVLKAAGFFSSEPLRVHGNDVAPLDLARAVLFNAWKLGEEEAELTAMRVTVRGADGNGRPKTVVYTLVDEYDAETKTSSMARTTGYTAAAAANLLLQGLYTEPGVWPPEIVGRNAACFDFILRYLADRGVHYHVEERAE